MSQEPNLYAAPTAEVMDIRQEGEFELAGRGTRLVASFLDGLFLIPIIWIFLALIIFLFFGANGFWTGFKSWAMWQSEHSILSTAISCLLGITSYLILNFHLLNKNAQTIGKKIMGIKIVRSDGKQADITRILLYRQLPVTITAFIPIVNFIFSLSDHLLIFRASRKCLHDNIADTIVIKV
ncbi:MAG: RDD family protein [Pseudomonadota bacterium]